MNHGRLRTPKQGYLIPEHSAGILAKNCHGLPGRTMGRGQGLVGRFDRKEGSQRKTPTGPSRGTQRDPVGMPDRGAMEGSPCPLSALPNVPSVLQSVVQCGCVGQGAVPACPGPARQREDRYHRVLLGRHLRKCQKRGRDIGPTKRGKGTKIMALTDAHGLPIAVRTFSARPNEVTLAERTVRSSPLKPERVIADRAYDSDKLRTSLAKRGIKLICPHRRNRTRKATQDGRTLRRYCRRWKVERLFSWLFNWRRTVVRYEYHVENYLGFVQLACIMILTRQLF